MPGNPRITFVEDTPPSVRAAIDKLRGNKLHLVCAEPSSSQSASLTGQKDHESLMPSSMQGPQLSVTPAQGEYRDDILLRILLHTLLKSGDQCPPRSVENTTLCCLGVEIGHSSMRTECFSKVE